jgi:hypothetical protein
MSVVSRHYAERFTEAARGGMSLRVLFELAEQRGL